MFPLVEIIVEFADEDIGSNCGILRCKTGCVGYTDMSGDDEFACKVKGYDYDEFIAEQDEE